MKLKKLTQILIMTCGLLALAACSSTKHANGANDSTLAMNDMNGAGTQAYGAGENDKYGSQDGANANQLAKRTYYFDYDKYDVREDDKPAVLANADYLVAHPNTHVILEGHTDPRGSREYNVALGENRAKSVLDILQSRGVNPNQVRVVSYGSQRPAVPGHSEQDYQLDRRAIITLTQN